MSPLEAARRLATPNVLVFRDYDDERWMCICCSMKVPFESEAAFVHDNECPSLSMPRIVAALEAAEAYLAPGAEGGGSLARLQALEAALKGEPTR